MAENVPVIYTTCKNGCQYLLTRKSLQQAAIFDILAVALICTRMLLFIILFWMAFDMDNTTDFRGSANKFTGLVRRCVEDYHMIADGETIAVGVSGGKDSISLLYALANLRRYYPKRFSIYAVTLDMGFEGMDFSPVGKLCEDLRIPYLCKQTDLAKVIFDERKEKNPCALCAKMRRGALHDAIKEMGISKIALAHHFDDAVETFLLSLIYEGRISCFQPVTYMDRSDVTQIRPMLYIGEGTIIRLIREYDLPVVENLCPMNGVSKREEVKNLLKTLGESYPDIKSKVFGAMQRLPVAGWTPAEYARRPLP